MSGHVDVALDDVRVGDWAHRIDQDLDARPVSAVLTDGTGTAVAVSLTIGDLDTGPIDADLYRYSRPAAPDDAPPLPCGCPADYTFEEHLEHHHRTDTPDGL